MALKIDIFYFVILQNSVYCMVINTLGTAALLACGRALLGFTFSFF